MFAVYLKDVDACLDVNTCILQYADDLVVYSSSKSVAKATQSLQVSLNNLCTYLNQRGMELSTTKTKHMFSDKKLRATHIPEVHIAGRRIETMSTMRFLGVTLDQKLESKKHLETVTQRGRVIVGVVASLAGVWWGLHPQMLLTVYRAVFRSSIEYGSQAFTFDSQSTFCSA